MTDEQYIEHEVKLRVSDERIKSLEAKYNWLIGIIMAAAIFPNAVKFFMHLYKDIL